jgi:hypothetical protein
MKGSGRIQDTEPRGSGRIFEGVLSAVLRSRNTAHRPIQAVEEQDCIKGFFITHDFLERSEARMKAVVSRIKSILEDRLVG